MTCAKEEVVLHGGSFISFFYSSQNEKLRPVLYSERSQPGNRKVLKILLAFSFCICFLLEGVSRTIDHRDFGLRNEIKS